MVSMYFMIKKFWVVKLNEIVKIVEEEEWDYDRSESTPVVTIKSVLLRSMS